MADSFCSPRDTHAELQRSKTRAKVMALMYCAQCGKAQPGFADSDGPNTSRGLTERQTVTFQELGDMR
jgi:hypothetical protein